MTMDLGFLWSKILRVRKKGREKKCVSTCIYIYVSVRERESVCVCVGVSEREREFWARMPTLGVYERKIGLRTGSSIVSSKVCEL